MTEKNTGIEARKMEIGESIQFDDVIVNQMFTQYGEVSLVTFFKGDVAIRKVFSNALAKHLAKTPDLRSITLKKKLKDGDAQFNVYV